MYMLSSLWNQIPIVVNWSSFRSCSFKHRGWTIWNLWTLPIKTSFPMAVFWPAAEFRQSQLKSPSKISLNHRVQSSILYLYGFNYSKYGKVPNPALMLTHDKTQSKTQTEKKENIDGSSSIFSEGRNKWSHCGQSNMGQTSSQWQVLFGTENSVDEPGQVYLNRRNHSKCK